MNSTPLNFYFKFANSFQTQVRLGEVKDILKKEKKEKEKTLIS